MSTAFTVARRGITAALFVCLISAPFVSFADVTDGSVPPASDPTPTTPVTDGTGTPSGDVTPTGDQDATSGDDAQGVSEGDQGTGSVDDGDPVDGQIGPISSFARLFAAPAQLYVDASTGDDSNDGTSADTAFKTIQAAVNAATMGETVNVAAGTYNEQVTINKNIVLVGAGASSTFISAPATLASEGAIVDVTGSSVTSADISGVTVEGPGPTACGSIMSGVFVESGAHANLHDMDVVDISDSSFSGCQNGRAILVGWGHSSTISPTTGSATINNVTITGYQKAGIEVSGTGSQATITNNTVTGVGATSVIAANGIEVTFGAAASISGNTVTANSYVPTSDFATGILLYQPGTVTIGANTVSGNEIGLSTNDQASVSALNLSGVTGNDRNAVADTTGWTTPTATIAAVTELTGKVADDDGNDIAAVNGTDYVFGYNGFANVQPALDAVATSGTVTIAAGTYSSDINVTKDNLHIVGAGAGSTILNSNGSNGYGIYVQQHTGFNLSGITFNALASDPSIRYALQAYQADGLTLSNVVVTGVAHNASNQTVGGVDANTTSNISYSNVSVSGFAKNGFSFTAKYAPTDTAAHSITLNNVTATNNGWTGIAFYTMNGSNTLGASITDVDFLGSSTLSGNGEGIFIEGDTDAHYGASATPVYTVSGPSGSALHLTNVAFSNNVSYDIDNYQTAAVNALHATFGGVMGDSMLSRARMAEDAKIHDQRDLAALGLVTYHAPDTTAPVITLNGTSTMEVVYGAGYTDAGATVTDNIDQDVTVTTLDGTVDTTAPGNHIVTYTATDNSGNTATSTRTVTVDEYTPNNGSGSGGGGGTSSNAGGDSGNNGGGSVGGGDTGGAVLGASTFNFTSDLTVGATGDDVTALQQALIDAGFLKIAAPTGFFGPLTRAAVVAYQEAHNIPATGFVGPLTRAQLNLGTTPTMSDETRSLIIQQIQDLMKQVLALQATLPK